MKAYKIVTAVVFIIGFCACHNGASDNDLYNTKAAVPQKFDVARLHLVVINTSVNKNNGTMSILYGNKLAFNELKQGLDSFKNGSLLALVTWKQQPDVHWFGANIPGELLSVEYVGANGNSIQYTKWLGRDMQPGSDSLHAAERAAFILDQKPSVMP